MISIIVSVYNVESYLRECLESIRSQTFSDYEVVLVDDESTDSSLDICKEYAEKDDRFKLLRIDHVGLAAAREIGYQKSIGEYVSFIDGDDWLEPLYCEKLLNAINEKENIDMAVCDFYEGSIIKNGWEKKIYDNKYDIICAYINNEIYNRMWNKMYKRHIVEGIEFSRGRDQFEDGFWMPQAVGKANGVVRIEDCLYHYRIRSGSLMTKKKKSKEIADDFINSFGRISTLLKYNNYIDNDYAINEYDNKIRIVVQSGYNINNFSVYETMKNMSENYQKILNGRSRYYCAVAESNNVKEFYHLYWEIIREKNGTIGLFKAYIQYVMHKCRRCFDKR